MLFKKKHYFFIFTVLLFFTACNSKKPAPLTEPLITLEATSATDDSSNPSAGSATSAIFPYTFSDAFDQSITIEHAERVVILYGSIAEAWLNGGGSLVGTTKDAVEERGLTLGSHISIVGTVKEPNLELIFSLNPDLVLMSADIPAQTALAEGFTQMNIPNASFRIDTFDDYLDFLRIACDISGNDTLYETFGLAVEQQIQDVLKQIPKEGAGTALLLRAYTTGAKAKTDDNFTGVMLNELGLRNIAEKYPSLLEDLSMEQIILEDPDYIFVTTMGDETEALNALHNTIEADPAWKSLKAVQNGHYIVLPKELFHYKPNARWGESYRYLANILYPDLFQ